MPSSMDRIDIQISCSNFRRLSSFLPIKQTLNPARASCLANDSPIPDVQPVITAHLFCLAPNVLS